MVSAQGEWYWQQRMGILCSRTLSMHAWKLCSSSSYLRWAQLLPLLLIHKIVSSSTTALIYWRIFWSAYVLETSHLLACTRYIKRQEQPHQKPFPSLTCLINPSIHPSINESTLLIVINLCCCFASLCRFASGYFQVGARQELKQKNQQSPTHVQSPWTHVMIQDCHHKQKIPDENLITQNKQCSVLHLLLFT